METRKMLSFALVLLFAFSPALCAAQASKPIVLRLAHFVFEKPAEVGGITDQFFADEVYKRTKGRVKIEIYWLETLGKVKELLGLVRDGTVEMAAFASGYFPTQFPFWRMPNGTPFVMASIEEAIQTAIRLPQQVPAIQEEIRKQNIKLLYSHVMPGFHLFARKPVEKFEGLKGLKVRTYGDILPKILHAANAVGVNVFPGEVYEALQKGVIDGGLFDLGGGYGPKVHEVAPHINLWNIMSIVAWGVWINQDTWNKLPADIQQVMLDVSKESVQFERNRAIAFENRSKEMLKKEGAIFHEVSTVERQKWINVSPNFLEEFIKAMAKQGKENEAIQFKKSWLEIIDKY